MNRFAQPLRAPEHEKTSAARGSDALMTFEPCESRMMMSATSFSSEPTVRITEVPMESVSLNYSKIVWRY